ncbi:hypothetical protein APX70_200263 [Pseudomonas syringae pv. maculicola]|uniref:Uncharacterized protein n=1 Tax=Pseudomonas syringae pv. maculicola TaxID=59511 RepID=A0A3M2W0H6_PSEYM|nr:hypothetical protein APX70_200263 [Pseudomonas syringae pv. maculicola]
MANSAPSRLRARKGFVESMVHPYCCESLVIGVKG